jgi:hypothetical protein
MTPPSSVMRTGWGTDRPSGAAVRPVTTSVTTSSAAVASSQRRRHPPRSATVRRCSGAVRTAPARARPRQLARGPDAAVRERDDERARRPRAARHACSTEAPGGPGDGDAQHGDHRRDRRDDARDRDERLVPACRAGRGVVADRPASRDPQQERREHRRQDNEQRHDDDQEHPAHGGLQWLNELCH